MWKILPWSKDSTGRQRHFDGWRCIENHAETGKQGKDSAAIYQGQGRADLAEAELAQVAVLEAYLPKQMSNEELEAALKEIIAEVGAAGPQDMGKVMGVATKKLAGKAEGRAISAKVKELLG